MAVLQASAPEPSCCDLPCAGCCEAVESLRGHAGDYNLHQSAEDGCWVVRVGQAEKLRSDDACLACSYFRNRAQLMAD